MSSVCLDENEVAELLSGAMKASRREVAEQHIDDCGGCRSLVAELAALEDDPSSVSTGALIDHFEVLRPLGRGGMGDVYAARDTKLGRKVALKMIRPQLLGSAEAIARFQREAEATARFSHPNIVTIHAVGEYGDSPYVALEYLEGETLQQRMARAQPDLQETLRIGRAIAEALAEAHRHGVLHRDLKPDNVHIGNDGRVRVLDFGLAKFIAAEEPTEPTVPGEVVETRASAAAGTPNYMAPEQWRGETITAAADAWAVGVILFMLLSGRRPFESDTARGLAKEVLSDRAATRLDHAPQPLVDLVARCLDKDPSARPGLDEIARILRAQSQGSDVAASPRWRELALIGALVVVVAGAVYVAVSPAGEPGSRGAPALDAPSIAPAVGAQQPAIVVPVPTPPPPEEPPESTKDPEDSPPRKKPRAKASKPKPKKKTKESLFGTRE